MRYPSLIRDVVDAIPLGRIGRPTADFDPIGRQHLGIGKLEMPNPGGRRRRGGATRMRGAGLLLAANLIAACANQNATPSPAAPASPIGGPSGGSPASQNATPSPAAPSSPIGAPSGGSPGPSASVEGSAYGPSTSEGAASTDRPTGNGQPAARAAVALPLPTLSEPFAVGQALYDPAQVDVGVVSLLALMRIGIYRIDGTPIRAGAEHEAGDPWLYDVEVRFLIDRTVADLEQAGDAEALPYHLSDVFAIVQPVLPDGTTEDQVVQAYTEAYASRPDDLVPQVMLGQPIDRSTPLSTIQAWLLLVDGFVGPATQTGLVVPGALLATGPSGPPWGTAAAALPGIVPVSGQLTKAELRELQGRLYSVIALAGFDIGTTSVHEGHGGPGRSGRLDVHVGPSRPLVSRYTGRPLLEQRNGGAGDTSGLIVKWTTLDQKVLDAHGSLDRALPAVDDVLDGLASILYDPKKEVANGVGVQAHDVATINASIDGIELVDAFYTSPDPRVVAELRRAQLGRTNAFGEIEIGWHTRGLEITVSNEYNVRIGDPSTTQPGTVRIPMSGMAIDVHRQGTDTATGVLTQRKDGTYRGVLHAAIDNSSSMRLTLPLAAANCEDQVTGATQDLYVIGTPATRARPPTDVELTDGALGVTDLRLAFYPLTPPSLTDLTECQEWVHYFGSRVVDGQRMASDYMPFNSTRWTDPGMGYTAHLPDKGSKASYSETPDGMGGAGPDTLGSTWSVIVDRTADE